MKNFKIKVTEFVSHVFNIEAKTVKEAKSNFMKKINNGDVNWRSGVCVDFEITEVQEDEQE